MGGVTLFTHTLTPAVPLHEPVQFDPPPPRAPPTTKTLNDRPLPGSTPSGVPAWSEFWYMQAFACDGFTLRAL